MTSFDPKFFNTKFLKFSKSLWVTSKNDGVRGDLILFLF